MLCIFIGLGLLAYGNAIFHPFVHDDIFFIVNNPHINQFDWPTIFLKTAIPDATQPLINSYYRPLLEIFYRIEYKIFHLNAAGYHLVNILFHIVNSFLVFLLMSRHIQRNQIFALALAILFLIHPIQTEAVACISGISNVLSVFLLLLSFYFYLSSRGHPFESGRFRFYSSFTFVLALLAKEQAIMLPLLIVWHGLCFPRAGKRIDGRKMASDFLIVSCYFLLRKWVTGYFTFFSEYSHELVLRLWAIPKALLTYLSLVLFPVNLHYYRSMDVLAPFVGPTIFLIVLICVLCFMLRCLAEDKRRLVIFGLGWFVLTLLPMLNIAPLINEYSFILTAEHFLYMPLIGMLLCILGIGQTWLEKKHDNRFYGTALIVFLLVAVVFVMASRKQNTFWRGEIPLFERTLKYQKNFARVHVLLGKAYYFDQQFIPAIFEYDKAFKIMNGYLGKVQNPKARQVYQRFIKDIYFDLAHCYEALADFHSSLKYYEKALSLFPKDSLIHNNIGVNYLNLGELDIAADYFQKAIILDENNLEAMNNLAYYYLRKGDERAAKRLLKDILKKDSKFAPALANLEKLLSSQNLH